MSFLLRRKTNKVGVENNECSICGISDIGFNYYKYPCSNIDCNVRYSMCPECSINSYKRKEYEYDYWDGDGMYSVMPKCPFCNKEDYSPVYNTLLSLNNELNRIDKPVRQCGKQKKYNLMPEWRIKFNKFNKKHNRRDFGLNNFNCKKVNYNDVPLFPKKIEFDRNALDYDYYSNKYTKKFHENEQERIKNWNEKLNPDLIIFKKLIGNKDNDTKLVEKDKKYSTSIKMGGKNKLTKRNKRNKRNNKVYKKSKKYKKSKQLKKSKKIRKYKKYKKTKRKNISCIKL